MALMNINVRSVFVDLIANLKTYENSCRSLFTFDVISKEGANIIVVAEKDLGYGYDKIELYTGTNWQQISPGSTKATGYNFVMGASGTAKVRVTIGNLDLPGKCNTAVITMYDTTHKNSNGVDRSEVKTLSRCVEATRC